MSNPMAGLDAWLEAPYVNAAREEAAFERWCEDTGTDPDADDAWERFEQDCEDARDDAMIERAEQAREDREDREDR